MAEKQTGSFATKLTGFAIVTAVAVFCAKNLMPIADQTAEQIQRSHFSTALVPVDGNSLSQQILPAQSNFDLSISIENTSSVNTFQESETGAQSYQAESQSDPSDYELKLDDQKAWGSQPRRASLVSTTVQSAASPEKVAVASSQTPIVPGHEDPHLWFESQHMQLAFDHEDQQEEEGSPTEPIEFTELPSVTPEEPISVLSLLRALSTEPHLVETLPEETLPLGVPSVKANSVKAVSTPPVRTAHAWETGRY